MAVSSHYTGGCSSCGGAKGRAAPASVSYRSAQPSGAGVPGAQRAGCGCACGGETRVAPPCTCQSAECSTRAPARTPEQPLRDCTREAVCDFLRCAANVLCPDGRFDVQRWSNKEQAKNINEQLVNCLGQLACNLLHCVPDALCPTPPAKQPATLPPRATPCLPCDYAVEVPR